jgi:glucose/arabinose dehydrogenase
MDFFVIAKFSVSGVIRLLFHERLFASVAVYTLSQLVLFPRAGSEDSMRVDKFKMVVLVLVVSSLVLTAFSLTAAFGQNAKTPALDKITLPKGFKIQVYMDTLPGARSMALSPSGILFVGTKVVKGPVYAIVDKDKDGKADDVYVIAKDLFMPNGVAFKNGSLYVAEVSRVLRFDNIEQHLKDPPAPVVVSTSLPKETYHGWKFIRFGPDDLLYIPIGAPCNVCNPKNPFASMMRMKANGTGLESYAKGIRNTVGFDWHPITKQLWFTDNGRDWLGDVTPPDELNCAPQSGMHFGFPFFYGNNHPDPEFGKDAPHDLKPTMPRADLGAHVAALGMRFYTGNMFPAEYRNQIFIAQHGSWNSSKKVGYQVALARLDGDKVMSVTPFAKGWLQPGEQVVGRPVDVQVMPDGALLVSDDDVGAIYRISYSAQASANPKPKPGSAGPSQHPPIKSNQTIF